MREGDADVPFLGGVIERLVIHILARAVHVEGRIPHLHRKRVPRLFIGACHRKRNGKACEAHSPTRSAPERFHASNSLVMFSCARSGGSHIFHAVNPDGKAASMMAPASVLCANP